MHASERRACDEALQGFDAERELAKRQRSFAAEASLLEPVQIFGRVEFRPEDDAEVLAAAYFQRRLD